jgi:hypothetical protein
MTWLKFSRRPYPFSQEGAPSLSQIGSLHSFREGLSSWCPLWSWGTSQINIVLEEWVVVMLGAQVVPIWNVKCSFSYDSKVANLESAHGQQLSEWNKKGERIERQLTNIETDWQQISFLEHSNKDEIEEHRAQLEVRNWIIDWTSYLATLPLLSGSLNCPVRVLQYTSLENSKLEENWSTWRRLALFGEVRLIVSHSEIIICRDSTQQSWKEHELLITTVVWVHWLEIYHYSVTHFNFLHRLLCQT